MICMGKQKKIYTIGYEGITVDMLVALLQAAKIQTLIDVRAVPLSRKAGFSKNMLAAHLAEGGIRYLGLRGLGTPPKGRLAAKKGDQSGMHKAFKAHLKTNIAHQSMKEAIEIALSSRACLLCFEHDPHCCHRLLVAEEMIKHTGQSIENLPSGKEKILL